MDFACKRRTDDKLSLNDFEAQLRNLSRFFNGFPVLLAEVLSQDPILLLYLAGAVSR